MKSQFAITLNILALIFTIHATATTTPISKDMPIAINDAFIPRGLNSTTEAYVIVSGIFPNGCYKWKGATLKDISKFEHEVTSMATVSQGMCIQVLVPFSKEIRLGVLDSGSHTLRFLSGDGTFLEKTILIE